jgi:hypothetical protein
MSAFGGKADMTTCVVSAFAVAIGAKADMSYCARALWKGGGRPPTSEVEGLADVRFGSKADMCGAKSHARFTPKSGHRSRVGAFSTADRLSLDAD